MMALRRLDHVLVLTDNVEATKTFYCDVLGLRVGDRPELPFPGFWLYANGAACVHVAERAPYDAHAASMGLAAKPPPVDHVAFEADAPEQLLERLGAAGVEVTTNAPASGVRQLFFDDPNGTRIELIVPE
jgi:catechol 2,3-dioxygenase-like lactoylglutathione lyase family enzyme